MGKTILVVDDSPDILFAVDQGLQDLGAEYIINSVESGEQCLKYLENHDIPDLIILDIMMPGMSGWQVFDRLKENDTWKQIPVVFLTARTDRVAKTAGGFLAEEYIEKPFEIEDLKRRIDTLLNNKKE